MRSFLLDDEVSSGMLLVGFLIRDPILSPLGVTAFSYAGCDQGHGIVDVVVLDLTVCFMASTQYILPGYCIGRRVVLPWLLCTLSTVRALE